MNRAMGHRRGILQQSRLAASGGGRAYVERARKALACMKEHGSFTGTWATTAAWLGRTNRHGSAERAWQHVLAGV